jgi:hypothetical protein
MIELCLIDEIGNGRSRLPISALFMLIAVKIIAVPWERIARAPRAAARPPRLPEA